MGDVSSESPLVGVPQMSSPEVPPDVSHSSSPARDMEVAASSPENTSGSGKLLRYLKVLKIYFLLIIKESFSNSKCLADVNLVQEHLGKQISKIYNIFNSLPNKITVLVYKFSNGLN